MIKKHTPPALVYRKCKESTPTPKSTLQIILNIHILDEKIEIADNSASIHLMKKYSVHLGNELGNKFAL